MLLFKSLYCIIKCILMLHSGKNIRSVKIIPRSCNDNRILVVLTKKVYTLGYFLVSCGLGMRKNDTGCVLNLVIIELTKVLHIHLALINVCNGSKAVKHRSLLLCRLGRLNNV